MAIDNAINSENSIVKSKANKRKGPPNRMNDLAYKDWMKFQKSFFWCKSSQDLMEECIHFFTKSIWPDGKKSRSLVIAFDNIDAERIATQRIINASSNCESIYDIILILNNHVKAKDNYDFILIDLRTYITDKHSLSLFLTKHSDAMFKSIRSLLYDQRYCGILVGTENKGGAGFPLPWAVAMSSRNYLRLRDEKIALLGEKNNIFYCLFFQANEDERPPTVLMPKTLHLAKERLDIPAWTIPKPPPRKKKEILHPAKFPETLISQFIELFSEPGDKVFDPMVGTGSTVLAAIRSNRVGYGVDLIPEFLEIAKDRTILPLFSGLKGAPKSVFIQGDATKLNEFLELRNVLFKYTITSPPYWSMLSNPGSEGQRERRNKKLPLVYSDNDLDLGNIQDYDAFLETLVTVYNQVSDKLLEGGYLTVVVKNVKRNHILYTLAWDLVVNLCGESGRYNYAGTTLWCQDDIGLKPFAVGIHWVSNTLHNCCLHFRKRRKTGTN